MTPISNNSPCGPILMVGPYPPVIGGTAAMLSRLVPALEEAGVACRVLNTGVGDRQGGIRERTRRLIFFKFLGLRTALAREKTIHCHAVNFANLMGNSLVLAACRLTGKRSVLTLHAGDLLVKLGKGRSRFLGRIILKLAHVVTTVTPELEERCRELGVSRVMFIPNDLLYTPHGSEGCELPAKVAAFIADHEPVVTLVGAMNPPYGIDVFLRAVAAGRSEMPHMGGLIIAFKSNQTSYTQDISRLITNLDLIEQVLIPEPFPNVAEALRRSDIFVRPTLSDGDSIAVREALTLGLPVIASDTGFRPGGVVVFPVGDHQALADRIGKVFRGEMEIPALDEGSEQETIARFIAAYAAAADK